ncbi:uncharacterized protein LOC127751678 [Frankliniella occidentalis]|uniref:Uncharacterized protein LOC127751678 n=1 Tax=Frankliniella occidentalis TaxID=133901 RepID=A0A9C6X984_FRAOC|nr:uncharacterized protein LOC127751678 [Frankliniella occidentalis]
MPFMSDYWKFLGNSLYGSFLSRPRKYRNIVLCKTKKEFLKHTRKPSYKNFRIFAQNFCAVECLKKEVTLSQPIFVSSFVLDHSKLHLTKLFWELKSHFSTEKGKNLQTLQFDTDSLIIKVTTEELEKDLMKLSHLFDFSSLPEWHALYDASRKKVPGLLKIELGGRVITEMVAVKSKVYAIRHLPWKKPTHLGVDGVDVPPVPARSGPTRAGVTSPAAADTQLTREEREREGGQEEEQEGWGVMRRCKGIPSSTLNKDVAFRDYKNCIFEGFKKEVTFFAIQSDGYYNVHTVQQRKSCLSAFDNKRKILEDGLTTIPFVIDLEGRETNWPEPNDDPGSENLQTLIELMETNAHV